MERPPHRVTAQRQAQHAPVNSNSPTTVIRKEFLSVPITLFIADNAALHPHLQRPRATLAILRSRPTTPLGIRNISTISTTP